MLTTFVIPSIHRPTLERAIASCGDNPVLVGFDEVGGEKARTRNKLIQQVTTPWVSFLDDDDTVTPDYTARLQQETELYPEAGCIIFREFFLDGKVIPQEPEIKWGNVGISFSLKTEVAQKYPFTEERYEDFKLLKRLEAAGVVIYFSPYLVYHARH